MSVLNVLYKNVCPQSRLSSKSPVLKDVCPQCCLSSMLPVLNVACPQCLVLNVAVLNVFCPQCPIGRRAAHVVIGSHSPRPLAAEAKLLSADETPV